MRKDFVTIRGEKIYVEDGTLDLSNLKVTDIDEVKGLENLINLKYLYLHGNPIKKMNLC
jgi:hypothetical protein